MSAMACSQQLGPPHRDVRHRERLVLADVIGLSMRVLAWILLLGNFCLAQPITVRLIDSKNGQGLAKQAVTVQFLYDNPATAPSTVNIESNSNGEAQISLPEATPPHLAIKVSLTSEHWYCNCWVMTETAKVLQTGIVQTAPAGMMHTATASSANSSDVAKPKPGEVVFFARPFNLFERLLYPLAKE